MSVSAIRVAAAQLDTVVGDLDGNADLIVAALGRAEAAGADVCVFPELSVTGYPPEDLLLKPGFVADNRAAMDKVAAATRRCAAVVGFVEAHGAGVPPGSERTGRPRRQPLGLSNAAAVCAEGRVLGIYRKRLLPNYGVFDEQRWFTPGDEPVCLYRIAGCLVGVSICEDIWFEDGPVPDLARRGAQVVVNLNSSPYSRGRRAERLGVLEARVAETGCAVVYANQVGGQDELVFDGASMIIDGGGRLVAAGRQFATDLVLADLDVDRARDAGTEGARSTVVEVNDRPAGGRPLVPSIPELLEPLAEVYEALVLGTRDYVDKNGFSGVVLGLSGGIDSALVATVAADALGPDRVHAVSMPSRYSSEGSRSDAAEMAERLGIHYEVVPIEAAHTALAGLLASSLGHEPTGLTDENLQSRVRGVVLMGLSNANGWLVLTTGNKSELATGYSTLYGDSAGGFAVIKDVPKTLVYELCRYRNRRSGDADRGPIPTSVLRKPPSAELRPGQTDDQSLPAYDDLDPVLEAYVERDRTAGELVAEGFDAAIVDQVVRLVDGAEYKRRQMPPGVRITAKAFGKDRRMPITNHYRLASTAEPEVDRP